MALTYNNATLDELLGLIPDPKVKEAFEEWEERGKHRLQAYTVKLDGKVVKAYGDLEFIDGQKSIEYETTYGDIIKLRGKKRPETLLLKYIIEYDHVKENEDEMKRKVTDIKTIKADRRPVIFSVDEIDVELEVTVETLKISYRGARDIYVEAELMEVRDIETEEAK